MIRKEQEKDVWFPYYVSFFLWNEYQYVIIRNNKTMIKCKKPSMSLSAVW